MPVDHQFAVDVRDHSALRAPVRDRVMLKSPVNPYPPRMPALNRHLFGPPHMPRRVEIVEILPRKNVPAPQQVPDPQTLRQPIEPSPVVRSLNEIFETLALSPAPVVVCRETVGSQRRRAPFHVVPSACL